MDEPQEYYAKWKKPDTKGYVSHDSIYAKHPYKANPKQNSGCLNVAEGGNGNCLQKDTKDLLGVMEMLLNQICCTAL